MQSRARLGGTWKTLSAVSATILGSVGGLVSASVIWWSPSSSGEAVLGLGSDGQVKALYGMIVALYCISLAAAAFAMKAPRSSALALMVTGGLSLLLELFGSPVIYFSAIYLLPAGFLILVGGAILAALQEKAVVPGVRKPKPSS
jgi:hypothetical protein